MRGVAQRITQASYFIQDSGIVVHLRTECIAICQLLDKWRGEQRSAEGGIDLRETQRGSRNS